MNKLKKVNRESTWIHYIFILNSPESELLPEFGHFSAEDTDGSSGNFGDDLHRFLSCGSSENSEIRVRGAADRGFKSRDDFADIIGDIQCSRKGALMPP